VGGGGINGSGVDFFYNNVLQPHQRQRIEILINPSADPLGKGWNVTQSKIAIGSGGLVGKGFCKALKPSLISCPSRAPISFSAPLGRSSDGLEV
jgi:rod shape determining protein RodA